MRTALTQNKAFTHRRFGSVSLRFLPGRMCKLKSENLPWNCFQNKQLVGKKIKKPEINSVTSAANLGPRGTKRAKKKLPFLSGNDILHFFHP